MARSTGDSMGTIGEVNQAPTGSQAKSETYHIHGGGEGVMPGDRMDGTKLMKDNARCKEENWDKKEGGEY